MECICPYCGKKSKSGELLFDFGKLFQKHKADFFRKFSPEEQTQYGKDFDGLINTWHNNGRGATFFSENELIRYTEITANTAAGVNSGRFVLSSSVWKRKLRSMADLIPDEYLNLVQVVLCDSFAENTVLMTEDLTFYPEGEGDVKINSVRDSRRALIASGRHCPHCGGVMSYWAGRYPEIVLTVLGGPRISKSSALAACADVFLYDNTINSIRWESHGVADLTDPGTDRTTYDMGDASWIQFEKRCLQPYRMNKKVEPTQIGNREAIPRFSVLVRIGKKTKLILTVVDLPGEYNQSQGQLGINEAIYREYQDFYQNVDCIWYCTDEAELRQIDVQDPQTQARFGYTSGRRTSPTTELVARLQQLSGLFRKDVPVAFLLGKSDTVTPPRGMASILYKRDYRFFRTGLDEGWLEIEGTQPPILRAEGFCNRTQQLRRYLSDINRELINNFESYFPVHTFLATSNYGQGFTDQQVRLQERHPFQTEVPFLWMLSMLGYLPVSEGDRETFAADHNNIKADSLTRENLGMFGRGQHGFCPYNAKTRTAHHKQGAFRNLPNFLQHLLNSPGGGDKP